MFTSILFTWISLLLLLLVVKINSYEIPNAKIEVFHPKGFEVSIPAEPGVTLFAFHGKINEEMDGLEAGTWSKDILKAKNGRFTFRNKSTYLKVGDILYYWTFAIHNGLGYREDNGEYIVRSYSTQDISSTAATTTTTTTTATPQPLYQYESDLNSEKSIHSSSTTQRPDGKNCDESVTTVNGNKVRCKNEIIFEEYFNDNNLNLSVWKLENRFSGEPDFEFVMYSKYGEALKVENNVLQIKPIKFFEYPIDFKKNINLLKVKHDFGASCTGFIGTEECCRDNNYYDILPPMISAQLSTVNSFNFRYGKIEIRAKLPKADWVYPQIWLSPTTSLYYGKKDYRSGQMRIAFTEGSNTCSLIGGVILTATEPLRTYKLCSKLCSYGQADWSENFHKYTLEWNINSIKLSIDDEEYCNIDPGDGFHSLRIGNRVLSNLEDLKRGTKLAPFDKEFHIRVGYGIGGNYEFNDKLLNKPWRNFHPQSILQFWSRMSNASEWLNSKNSELQIDYVKVYSI